jgi:hypothetical protein
MNFLEQKSGAYTVSNIDNYLKDCNINIGNGGLACNEEENEMIMKKDSKTDQIRPCCVNKNQAKKVFETRKDAGLKLLAFSKKLESYKIMLSNLQNANDRTISLYFVNNPKDLDAFLLSVSKLDEVIKKLDVELEDCFNENNISEYFEGKIEFDILTKDTCEPLTEMVDRAESNLYPLLLDVEDKLSLIINDTTKYRNKSNSRGTFLKIKKGIHYFKDTSRKLFNYLSKHKATLFSAGMALAMPSVSIIVNSFSTFLKFKDANDLISNLCKLFHTPETIVVLSIVLYNFISKIINSPGKLAGKLFGWFSKFFDKGANFIGLGLHKEVLKATGGILTQGMKESLKVLKEGQEKFAPGSKKYVTAAIWASCVAGLSGFAANAGLFTETFCTFSTTIAKFVDVGTNQSLTAFQSLSHILYSGVSTIGIISNPITKKISEISGFFKDITTGYAGNDKEIKEAYSEIFSNIGFISKDLHEAFSGLQAKVIEKLTAAMKTIVSIFKQNAGFIVTLIGIGMFSYDIVTRAEVVLKIPEHAEKNYHGKLNLPYQHLHSTIVPEALIAFCLGSKNCFGKSIQQCKENDIETCKTKIILDKNVLLKRNNNVKVSRSKKSRSRSRSRSKKSRSRTRSRSKKSRSRSKKSRSRSKASR